MAQVGQDQYLVQYFHWIIGYDSTLAVIPITEMECPPKDRHEPWRWQFSKDAAHMNDRYEQHGEALKQKAKA